MGYWAALGCEELVAKKEKKPMDELRQLAEALEELAGYHLEIYESRNGGIRICRTTP